jgi:hypothetical protein
MHSTPKGSPQLQTARTAPTHRHRTHAEATLENRLLKKASTTARRRSAAVLVTTRRSSGFIARQGFPNIGKGQTELTGDLRWLDASLECGSNCIQFSKRQRNSGRFNPSLA